ncbi:hypothetical protein BKI52_04550 [marine bacterium AO1-C]|nr:hypothetical protein BKI52_04550 [marine bacterium AO1-C]
MKNQKNIAFMEAYHACQQRFIRYCTVLAYGRMEVEDLAQDVLLATYERFDQIKQKDQLIGYLVRTARNRSVDYWRKNRYQTELLEKHAEELSGSGLSPETTLDIQLLYKTLDRLSAKQRDAIILFEICGFSIQEIADIQKSNSNTVKSHLNRGRKKLRQLLEEKPRSRWLLGVLAGTNDQALALPTSASPAISSVLQTGTQSISRLPLNNLRTLFRIPSQAFHQVGIAAAIGGLCLLIPLMFNHTITSVKATPVERQIGSRTTMATMPTQASILPIKPTRPVLPKPDKTIQVNSLTSVSLRPVPITTFPQRSIASVKPQVLSPLPMQSTFKVPAISQKNALPINKPLKNESLQAVNDCDTDSIKIDGKDKENVLALLRELKKDGITSSRRAKSHFSFSDGEILVNQQKIPSNLQNKYLKVLSQWGIVPCSGLQLKFFPRGVDIRYRKNAKGGRVRSNVKINIRF